MPKPWEGEGGSFGSWLRQQREIRSISLREIADNTKIGLRYLAALEEDRFEVLPAPIFAKGFLREYAKYVGLDPDEVVNFYLTAEQRHRVERGGDEISGVLPMSPSNATVPPARGLSLDWVIAAGAVLLLALLVSGIVWMIRHHRPDKKSTVQVEATPPTVAPVQTMAPTAEPTAASPSAPLVVTLSFTAECWVDALVDGERRVSVLRVQGESMHIDASDSVVLTLGNASAVRADVNGKPLRLGSAPGQVVRDLVIDRTTAGLPPAAGLAADGH